MTVSFKSYPQPSQITSLFSWHRRYRMSLLSTLSAMGLVVFSGWALAKNIDWESLNLTPQQEIQVSHLEEAWKKVHAEIGAQIEHDTAQLRAILPTGNTQQIRELQNRITTNKIYLMNQSMETFLKKRDTLTPIQRAQLQKMLPAKSRLNIEQTTSHNHS